MVQRADARSKIWDETVGHILLAILCTHSIILYSSVGYCMFFDIKVRIHFINSLIMAGSYIIKA